ncbi:hypothetical protein Leryth_014103 [Lithospermum erythrorhizon]|nr:hypothetical protein Leryth_014103 [Lithospermum erythrorhizon]
MDLMEPIDAEVVFQFETFIKVYKSGKVERLIGTDIVPPTSYSVNNVASKDVTISPEKPVSARLYLPTNIKKDEKLPLLIYFHGRAFCLCSPFCALYHNYLKETLVLNDVWKFTCPESSGVDDVRVNPALDPRLPSLGCTKILVAVVEKDEFEFRDSGWIYYEAIKKSGWNGEVEFHEGQDFHIFNPAIRTHTH